jgi:hypothetical protein
MAMSPASSSQKRSLPDSLAADETAPEDPLARVRGHWRVERERVITLFRIHGVTSFTGETRRIAQDLRLAPQILDLTGLSAG